MERQQPAFPVNAPRADMPLLVQFGAGGIGRSFVGQLFSAAGWEVVFLDVDSRLVEALNRRRSYRVVVKDSLLPGQAECIEVGNVSALPLSDRDGVVEVLKRADLVGTSVGAANLGSVCGLVAEAMPGRTRPFSLLLCENLHNAARAARTFLAGALPPAFPLGERIGLVEAAISKMVPPTPMESRERDPLEVWAEAYNTLYLDSDGFLGTPPIIPGVAWRRNFSAYVDRKLLVHNFGHAAAAYNGFLAGRTYIWECMEDAAVREETAACMMEAAAGLAARHPAVFTFDENRAWVDDLLRRFANRALGDPVFRVGRDLGRKLAPADRCVGALRLSAEAALPFGHTARAVAAGMLFSAADEAGKPFPGDAGIVALAGERGPGAVLTGLCGMDPERDGGLIDSVSRHYRELGKRGGV